MTTSISSPSIVCGAICFLFIALGAVGCAPATPGPDKQFAGGLKGALVGAGAGAVTGAQVASATGPGAAIGAGFGFVAGGIHGFAKDQAEEDLLKLAAETREERKRAIAHEILNDHFKRRLELHPTRDILPADLFFSGDESELRPAAEALVEELARLNKNRAPYSRLVVTAYVKGAGEEASFSQYLASERSRNLVNGLIRAGLEPRRLVARGVTVEGPLLLDPEDRPDRYNQAIEFIPLDR